MSTWKWVCMYVCMYVCMLTPFGSAVEVLRNTGGIRSASIVVSQAPTRHQQLEAIRGRRCYNLKKTHHIHTVAHTYIHSTYLSFQFQSVNICTIPGRWCLDPHWATTSGSRVLPYGVCMCILMLVCISHVYICMYVCMYACMYGTLAESTDLLGSLPYAPTAK